MKTLTPLALSLCMASTSALAQTGSLTWEVSGDGGVTWHSSIMLISPSIVNVRARFEWAGIPAALGFGGSQFDAVILNGSVVDSVSHISRPSPFDFAAQTLVASNYAGGIKIDTSTDLAAPGTGTGWINPGQGTPDGVGTNFVQQSPAVVFTYWYHVADLSTSRFISSVFNTDAGRALSVYTSASGAQIRLSADRVIVNNALIYVPSPSVAAVFPLAGVLGCRRRR